MVAVDSHGNPSLPSPPVTFTVPPPANATCAVHYAQTGSWPGGFQASVTITNKAASAVNGWTADLDVAELGRGDHPAVGRHARPSPAPP